MTKRRFGSVIFPLLGFLGSAVLGVSLHAADFDAPYAPPALPASPAAEPIKWDAHILVDQFGYRPGDKKIAVIRTPKVGYDAASTFAPGTTYQVRRATDGEVVFSGKPSRWNGGAVEASSGDSGWWFDFSAVVTPGRYFLYDATQNLRSALFNIDIHVYKAALQAATRVYYYQRSGSSDGGGAKRARYAGSCWVDERAYVGADQDTQAHDATDPHNSAKAHDLSGGWFDAGDTNKYVTLAVPAVHQLLTAYVNNPDAFTDDFGIPESGNGIPDLIDEVKYEIDWLKKMQYAADGSAALKVGAMGYPFASPPSSDKSPRFYLPSCTSATIAVSGMFAHAAYVYGRIPALAAEGNDLKQRALNAWKNYQGTATKQEHCDTGIVKSGNADWNAAAQDSAAVVAAVYLYALTDDPAYTAYIKAHYTVTRPYHDIGWSRYNPQEGEALLFYSTIDKADRSLAKTILGAKAADVGSHGDIYGSNNDDLYRNLLNDAQYHWGSNQVRANYGNTNADIATYSIDVSSAAAYQERALDTLHYFHGVNPFAKVFLSNMSSYGATNSVNAIWHSWYWPGSKWADAKAAACGPAPGYVTGGPVANAGSMGVPAELIPPINQPPQKSYRDWNGVVGNPQNAWVVSEPGIYYQAAYVELLSRYAR
jgi:endoglucanase